MNILVTGGAGFIGSHLVDSLLKDGNKVICIDDLSLGRKENIQHNLGNKSFVFVKIDMLDIKSFKNIFKTEKIDCVFHLAANSDIQKGSTDRYVDLNRTFMTTFNVLECMQEFKVKNLVFSSTSAIYGDTGDNLVKEDYSPMRPISFYGASKLSSEAFISAYAYHYGIKVWIFRFPNVVGERSTHGAIYDFINKLKNDPKKIDVLGNGTQEKPYIYVKDLVEAMIFVWKNAKSDYNYYNIGTKDLVKVRDMVNIVIEEMDLKDVKINYGKENFGWKGDVPKFAYDTSKIEKLGWKNKRSSADAVRLSVRGILGK